MRSTPARHEWLRKVATVFRPECLGAMVVVVAAARKIVIVLVLVIVTVIVTVIVILIIIIIRTVAWISR